MTAETDPNNKAGLALLCDSGGVVLRIIRDQLGVAGEQLLGQPFTRIVDEGSLTKALNFLVQIREQQVVFGWELNVPLAQTVQTLHFGGTRVAESLLIFAGVNGSQMLALYEQLTRLGNEQAKAVHTTVKVQAEAARRVQQRDASLYNEITRLNNELGVIQRELTKKNLELERLNDLKNQFLGMAAHDLRNPLNAIQGYTEFLHDRFDAISPEERQEFLSIILSSSKFMAELVNDLLDVAKIESGKLELNLVPVDLVRLARKNVHLNCALASAKNIQLRLEHEELPVIVADPHKIEQVFNNLISNALKYSQTGSQVTVALSQPDQDYILIAIADQGQGIPADQLDKLFRPFTTTTVRTTAGEKSTGLGLVIVRRIVEGHGGTIRVESAVGAGTTFYVTLPVSPAEPSASESRARRPQ